MTNKDANKLKSCFVICPIGEINTKDREYSDKVLKYLIAPVVECCGYDKPIRADRISAPGIITSQVIDFLIGADLIIADLSRHNANVFYELAIRHMIRKPIVQIINANEILPFDVNQSRTIKYDPTDPESVHNFKIDLEKQIAIVEKDPSKVDNPISVAVDINSLKQSNNALERLLGKVVSGVEEMSYKLAALESRQGELKYYTKETNDNLPKILLDGYSPIINFTAGNSDYEPVKLSTPIKLSKIETTANINELVGKSVVSHILSKDEQEDKKKKK